MENKENIEIAKIILNNAIQNSYSEIWINHYIKFLDGLKEEDRNEILLDKDITKLIDKINGYVDNEIELNKIHMEIDNKEIESFSWKCFRLGYKAYDKEVE
jgi:hypothetical protein